MARDKIKPTVNVSKEFPEGSTFVVTPEAEVAGEKILVRCSEGALNSMLWHGMRGLPKGEEIGSISGSEAVEVKGFLLGTVDLTEERRIITIKEVVQLPHNPQDAGDAAYFNAKDRAVLEGKLRSRPSLQMVGNYHSHPNHDIKLSDQDVVYLSQYLPETYHVAAIVGPRERALGFFLKNTEGEYAPWQDPNGRIDFIKDEKKKSDSGRSTFDWRPDITVEVDEDGNVRHMTGKKIHMKRLIGLALLGAVAIAILSAVVFRSPARPVMSASNQEVALASSRTLDEVVVLSLDRKGQFKFIIDEQTLPSWLNVTPMRGELSNEEPGSIRIIADTGYIRHKQTENFLLEVIGSPISGKTAEGSTVQISVSATNDIPIEKIEKLWDLPPLRVFDGRYRIELPADPRGSDVEITVQGFRTASSSWGSPVWTRQNESEFWLDAASFGNPLDWQRIKIEAEAIVKITNPEKIRWFVYNGEQTLAKNVQKWDLNTPESSDGEFKLVTKPVAFEGQWRMEVDRGEGGVTHTKGIQAAGQYGTHVFAWSPDLEAVRFRLGYVGKNGVYELRYQSPPLLQEVYSADDLAFDATQGPQGKAFRKSHPGAYDSANLSVFGKLQGPLHLEDIPQENRWGRLTLVPGNLRAHEGSWGSLVAIGKEAKKQGKGEMAWRFDLDEGVVALDFVFPEADYKGSLAWLLDQDSPELKKLLDPMVKNNQGRLAIYSGPKYEKRRGYIVQ